MTARIIIGPWPGSNVIPLRDCRTEFAAEVERRMFAMAEAAMEGECRLPGRFIEECLPSDTEML